jgi:hypothetical protein
MPNFIFEDQIERALVRKLQHLHGFDVLTCHTEETQRLATLATRKLAALAALKQSLLHQAFTGGLRQAQPPLA